MKIPLTKFGMPQVLVIPLAILAAMALVVVIGPSILPTPVIIVLECVFAIVLIWALSFFRDPHRDCPKDENLLLSPADGKITEIETLEGNEYIGTPAIKVGIFLSIFNVHINRAPCNVKVEKIVYKEGFYKNALNPESSQVNESNELRLTRTNAPNDKLIVKQISGAIARRIVCKTNPGKELVAGEKFGMIKFGSRTELYVPVSNGLLNENTAAKEYEIKCLVKIGDNVKAGITPLLRYEKCRK